MSFKSDKLFMFNLLLKMFLITYCLLLSEYVKVRKINKISKFFQKLFGISAQPQKDPAVPEPLCIPEANVPEQEPQVTELSVLENYISLNISQLKKRLEECTLSGTPVTEIWPNILLGNEQVCNLYRLIYQY